MTKKKCQHKDIIITIKEKYHYPDGLYDAQEKDDYDATEYLVDEEETAVFCEDCGEYLNEY